MKRLFDYSQDFSKIDFRQKPERYQVGKGEQGVLSVEPYKSEILPYWKFKNPDVALQSAKKIFSLFKSYKKDNDFVGMDMARKFLQMGYTRSRRYANHKSGRKYSAEDKTLISTISETPAYKTQANRNHHEKSRRKIILPLDPDLEKAKSAEIFYGYYQKAKNDTTYSKQKELHKAHFG